MLYCLRYRLLDWGSQLLFNKDVFYVDIVRPGGYYGVGHGRPSVVYEGGGGYGLGMNVNIGEFGHLHSHGVFGGHHGGIEPNHFGGSSGGWT